MAPAAALYAQDWIPFVLTLLILAAVGGALWLAALVWTTWIMHRPPRMTAGRALARLGRASPQDVGLNSFEEVVFGVPDMAQPGQNMTLAAWWISHPAAAVRRCCILLHGYGDSRAGSLAWAPLWQELGFHLLLLDLRAHGDSGGRLSGGGGWEKADLHAVIDELRHRYVAAARQIVLFGVSYGGLIAAACAAERDDLAALVMDSPVEGWGSATRRYAELLGLPVQRAHNLRLRLAQRVLRVRFDDVRPANTLPQVSCPILAILPGSDVLVAPEESAQMARAVEDKGPPSRVWRAAASHNLAIVSEPAVYGRVLREFLEEALAAPEAQASAVGE